MLWRGSTGGVFAVVMSAQPFKSSACDAVDKVSSTSSWRVLTTGESRTEPSICRDTNRRHRGDVRADRAPPPPLSQFCSERASVMSLS